MSGRAPCLDRPGRKCLLIIIFFFVPILYYVYNEIFPRQTNYSRYIHVYYTTLSDISIIIIYQRKIIILLYLANTIYVAVFVRFLYLTFKIDLAVITRKNVNSIISQSIDRYRML